jgi:outer membrane protein assembly factor BamB/tetratricopeptide (TPR) repeat protein
MGTVVDAADQPRKMLETAKLPEDSNVLKRFNVINDYLEEKRWTEAIDLLQEISQTAGRLLVESQPGVPGKTGVYLNVGTRCNILLSQLPAEGLAAFRRKIDPQAQRWLDQWKRTRDDASLRRVVREAFLSSHGDEALWALAESAWDRGDFATAELYWTQLVPLGKDAREANLPTVLRYPDSKKDPAEVLARLVLCRIMEGNVPRATADLKRFQEMYPDAEGTLAGRQARLSDLLTQILEESAQWQFSVDSEVATFGLNSQRCGTLPDSVEIGASRWSRTLPQNPLPRIDRPNATPDRGPLSYHPVTFQNFVLVNNARTIWAWNLLTGEPAWPSARGTAEIYPPAPDDVTGMPNESPYSGVPYYTMTIADGRLYARMGSPVTNAAERENAGDSDLVCLDLVAGQGKLVWKIAAHELVKEEHSPWRFEGSPLVMGGRAYVALSRRRPQFEFSIACMDAASGTLLWNRQIVSARGTVEDHQNRISHLLLTAGAGKVFLSTDAGAIVAVDAHDGRLEWAVTYESVVPRRLFQVSSHLHQGLLPAMFHDGFVFVAPNDCNRLFCIEADSGRVRWQLKQPAPDRWRHLLGIVPGGDAGRLIVSGSTLASIDIATKRIVFGGLVNGQDAIRIPPVEQGYGRGVLAGNVILWPTRESIKIVDAVAGTVIGNKPLHAPGAAEMGGNLTVSQGMLIVAQPERLVAYCEYSLMKQRLEKELSNRNLRGDSQDQLVATSDETARYFRHLSTEDLLVQLSDVEFAQGNLDAAVQTLRKALDVVGLEDTTDASTRSRLRNRLLELLRQAARVALSEGFRTEALERLIEARQIAVDPPEIVAVLMEMADVELARSRLLAAVGYWQQILDDVQLRDVSVQDEPAGRTAAIAISRLINDRGRAVYAELETRATTEIANLLKAKDLDGLQRTLERYPHAEAAGRAWRDLATLERKAGRARNALAIQSRLVDQSVLPEERATCLAEWADTFEEAGYWRPAWNAWRQLVTDQYSACRIEFNGATHRAGELARQRLRNSAYEPYEPRELPVSTHLDRAWVTHLDPRDHESFESVVLPRHASPSTELECILVHRGNDSTADAPGSRWTGSRWECLDRASGRVRWSRKLPATPQWAAYSDMHLLLATANQLAAVSLETGEELWVAPLATPSDPVGNLRLIGDGDDWSGIPLDDRSTNAVVPVQVCLRGRWLLKFDPRMGVVAVDVHAGKVAWKFHPPHGTLQRHWACGTDRIALQTLQPATTWLLDIAPDRRVRKGPVATSPWSQAPLIDGDESWVTINQDRQIQGHSPKTGRRLWVYQGGVSYAYVDPVLWTSGPRLLMTIDGTSLTSVNRATGQAEWTAGISDRPMEFPARQVIATSDAAFAASQGLLRRISLKNGERQWERYLGSTADQWQVTATGKLVAAWPIVPPTETDSARQTPTFVAWCDAASGRIVQTMTITSDEHPRNVSSDDQGWLVRTSRRIVAFSSAPGQRDVVSAGFSPR